MPGTARWVVLAALCAACRGILAAEADAPLVLTNVSQIRALSSTQLDVPPKVRLEAVVTLSSHPRGYLWVQQDNNGIMIYRRGQTFTVQPGDKVLVTGTANRGENGPFVTPEQIEVSGKSAVPQAAARTGRELISFADLNRLVQVNGQVTQVVTNSIHWQIAIDCDSNQIWLDLAPETNRNAMAWMGATVQARGVCTRRIFDWGDVVVPALLIESASDLQVLTAGHSTETPNLESLATTPIGNLSRAIAGTNAGSMVHVRGNVVDQRLGEQLIVRDSSGTIIVGSSQMTLAPAPAEVEVWGVPAWDGTRLALRDATYRLSATNAPTAVAGDSQKPSDLPVLTRVRDVLELSQEKASWRYPVRIHGTVTLFYPLRRQIYVQDSTSGVYVYGEWSRDDLKPGDIVDVQGTTQAGSFAPMIVPTNMTVTGWGPLPEPRQTTLFQLAGGQFDSQWVEERGVVRSLTPDGDLIRVRLSDPDGSLTVNLPARGAATNMVDAVIRVRGVCAVRPNARRQISSVAIWSPSMNFITVEQPPVAEPLKLPVQTIASLREFRPHDLLPRRTRITGVVTLCQGARQFFVQDDSDGILVEAAEPVSNPKPGDRVEVAGYPLLRDSGNVLADGICRVIGAAPLPPAAELKSDHALDPLLDNTRVAVQARVLNCTRLDSHEVVTLQIPGSVFEAHAPAPAEETEPGVTPGLPPTGSLVRLTGIYRVLTDEARVPTSFRILLPALSEIVVVEKPGWWTMDRALAIVAALTLIIAAGAGWVFSLRRQVAERTASLRESETKFRSLVEESLVGVYVIRDGRFVYANPRLGAIFGYTAEELMNSCSFETVVHPEDLALVTEQIRRRIAGEVTTAHYGFRGLKKDGTIIHLEVLGTGTETNGQRGVLGTVLDITERRNAEEELHNSRQMLRTVLDTFPQRVFWKNRDSVYLGCNKPFAEDCGYTDPAGIVGRTDYETISAELAEKYREDDARVMSSGVPKLNFEEPQSRANGAVGWLKTSKVPLFDQNGQCVGILGTYEDVTERKQAEAALAEASTLLETLLEHSPDHIYFKDLESRFVQYSRSFAELLNIPDTLQLKGKTDFDLFAEEHARRAFEDEQRIIQDGSPIVGKLEHETHRDGRTTWALTNKLPWRDKNGNIIGTFGISKDITAIKEAEEKLAYERELFQTLLDTLPDTIYFKDRESRFVRVSKSKVAATLPFARALHEAGQQPGAATETRAFLASEEEFAKYLIGRTDFDTYPEAPARVSFDEEQAIVNTGTPVIGKLEQVALPDGTQQWMLITKMPWRDKDGNIIGTFGISRDITAIKEAEAQLQTAQQRLIETSRLAGMAEVATDVLHNVGNVLNSVNVSGSLILDRVRTSKLANLSKISGLLQENQARLAEFLSTDPRGMQVPNYVAALAEYGDQERVFLIRELEQLIKHIDHIKQIVAMQQSYAKVSGVLEQVSPTQLVEDALQINSAALKRHQVRVHRDFDDVPRVLTEKHKVLQILVNLITNAKYAIDEAEKAEGLLTLKVCGNGGGVKIEVTDNGVGIQPENITRIFSHGFTTRRNGHGFGLHSSALTVRELGGSLEAHSDGPGHGATFTLTLPIQPPKNSL